MSDLPLLLPIPDAAHQLGVSAATMRRMVASGEIPSILIGGRRKVQSDVLLHWISQQSGYTDMAVSAIAGGNEQWQENQKPGCTSERIARTGTQAMLIRERVKLVSDRQAKRRKSEPEKSSMNGG